MARKQPDHDAWKELDAEHLDQEWRKLNDQVARDETLRAKRKRDKTATFMRIPVDQIAVDPHYQRPVHERRIESIKQHGWDEVSAEVITVNLRENGELYCLNGQHRVLAARELGIKEIDAKVFDGLTYEEEAEGFLRINRERAVIAVMDRFRASLEFGDPESTAINEAVEAAGYSINLENHIGHPDKIFAVAALQTMYRWGGVEGLTNTLKVVKRLWPDETTAVNGVFLQAVHQFLSRHSEDMDWERFWTQFERATPGMIQRAGNARRLEDPKLSATVARYLGVVDTYNGSLRKGRLIPKTAILMRSQAEEIKVRALYLGDNQSVRKMLSQEYGVSRGVISDILRGLTFTDIVVDPENIKPEHQHWAASQGMRAPTNMGRTGPKHKRLMMEERPGVRLNREQVYEIRVRLLAMPHTYATYDQLAKEYDVGTTTIQDIAAWRTWPGVTVDINNIKPECRHWIEESKKPESESA